MKPYRQWGRHFLLLVVGVLLLIGATNYVVDPLQQYRQASFYTPIYKSSRYLNPGLAKTHAYDTALIGTSMVENCRPSYMDRVLGGRSIKLPMSAGSAFEEGQILQVVLRRPSVKRVLIGLDIFSFKGARERLPYGPGSLPLYLYDTNLFNDVQYLLSLDTLDYYRYLVRSNLLGKKKDPTTYDDYEYWANRARFGAERVWQNWQSGQFNRDFRAEDFAFSVLKASFDHNLLPLLQRHPQVRFELFFPPYSALVWVDLVNKGVLEEALAFKQYVVAATQTLDRVRVYDFQDNAEITHNLDNYKDISHYRPQINDWMIDSIARGDHLVNGSSVAQRQRQLRQQVQSFIAEHQELQLR